MELVLVLVLVLDLVVLLVGGVIGLGVDGLEGGVLGDFAGTFLVVEAAAVDSELDEDDVFDVIGGGTNGKIMVWRLVPLAAVTVIGVGTLLLNAALLELVSVLELEVEEEEVGVGVDFGYCILRGEVFGVVPAVIAVTVIGGVVLLLIGAALLEFVLGLELVLGVIEEVVVDI